MPGHYSCRVVNEDLFNNSEGRKRWITSHFKSDISNTFGLKQK